MRIEVLTHVPFEGLGWLETYFNLYKDEIHNTKLYEEVSLPDHGDYDLLVVMGGPMGIEDTKEFSWLQVEKAYIKKALELGKKVLGICLGAQLLAAALGAKVYPGPYKEIGWYPIQLTSDFLETNLGKKAFQATDSDSLTVFHWHGDTFEIPQGAVKIASSEPGINQGYLYKNQVIGLQFHVEMTMETISKLIDNSQVELSDQTVDRSYIMEVGSMTLKATWAEENHEWLKKLLDVWLR